MHRHRVTIQYLNPLNRQVQSCASFEHNTDINDAITRSLDNLTSSFDLPIEVLSLYVSSETL